jgi:hypothetical protein
LVVCESMYVPCPWPLQCLQNWCPPHNASFEQSETMVIRWGKIWSICWVGQRRLEFQFSRHFSGCCCCTVLSVVITQNNSIYQHYSVYC